MLLFFFPYSAQIQTNSPPQTLTVIGMEPGANLTLTCPASEDQLDLFYWYKMKFGYMVQTIAAGTIRQVLLEGAFVDSRFTLQQKGSSYFLDIKNVCKEDEATYICQMGPAYSLKFKTGIVLHVKGKKI